MGAGLIFRGEGGSKKNDSLSPNFRSPEVGISVVGTFKLMHNILKQQLAGTTTLLDAISIQLKTPLVMIFLDLCTPQFLFSKRYNKHFRKGVLHKEFKNITCIFNENNITHL